jgi:acetyl-CoA synthetase
MQNLNLKYVNETYDEHGILTKFSLNIPENFNFAYDIVDEIARVEPNRRAMLWCNEAGEERSFSFGEMKKHSDKTANYFKSLGIGKGDMVMLILKRHYQFWFAILALHKLGAVAIPGTNLLTKKDIIYRVNSADIKAVVCTADGNVSQSIDDAGHEVPTLKIKMMSRGCRDGWLDFDKEVENASADFVAPTGETATKSTDPLLIYFTSGTTGFPKMVMHDHTYPLAHILTAKHWHNVRDYGLHLTLAETGWAKAVWGKLYGQWIMEAGIFVYDYDRFVPTDLLKMIEKYKITTFCAPPTIFRFFIKDGMEGFDLSSLKYATIAGEALNPEVFNRFYEYTGIKLMEGFGQTETTLSIANLTNMTPKPGSMGKPSPAYTLDLIDDLGKSVKTGEVGEIVIRTDEGKPVGMFCGYYRDADLTNSVWYDNIYHTGDTAWADEDGYYWYVGRLDDIIKSSGYRIGPFEIESVLMEHKAVLECAVTGVPDPVRGQLIKATIVLTKGHTPSDKLIKEIQDYVKKQTAPYKYPRIIEFCEQLPKTISGKIRRVEIRDKK